MVLVAICKIPTKESINMAVLIGNNGTGKNLESIKDEISTLEEAMVLLDELIKWGGESISRKGRKNGFVERTSTN